MYYIYFFVMSLISPNIFIINGLYIPFIYIGLIYFTNNLYLSSIISLKLLPLNYYYWFGNQYNFLPYPFNFLKQFVRFTDSGHLASFIYFIYPQFLPIAFNVHFTITTAYWIAILFCGMEDLDSLNDNRIIKWFEKGWASALHIVPSVLLLNELLNLNTCPNYFTFSDLLNSYRWLHCWFLYIYIPWRVITKDYMYSVVSPNKSIKELIYFVLLIHFLVGIGHSIGFLIIYNCK